MVAFIPFDQNQIGWVPLAPGEVYVPHYYNTTWQPYYLTRDNLYQRTVNLNVPGAVTVVNVDEFDRGIDWKRVRKADRNMLTQVNPVLDPLLLTPLRNAVVHSAWGRGKIDIPPGIAKKLNDTTVVTSTTPAAPPFRPDLAKTMHVNNAPDRAKEQKFQVRDERRGRAAPPQVSQQAPAPVQQQRPVEQQGGRGQEQREARRVEQQQRVQQRVEQKARVETPREARRVEQQQRVQQREQPRVERRASAPQAERPARPAQQQPRGESVAAPARPAPAPARAQPQPQQKHERPPQAQEPQQQKQERAATPKGGPPASPDGGKGKGKKP